jgi:hypothetical protein
MAMREHFTDSSRSDRTWHRRGADRRIAGKSPCRRLARFATARHTMGAVAIAPRRASDRLFQRVLPGKNTRDRAPNPVTQRTMSTTTASAILLAIADALKGSMTFKPTSRRQADQLGHATGGCSLLE